MPNHHYVPQFYLRRFGTDTHVSAILMNRDFRFVESAKIRGQSYRRDYYRFPEVESIFSQIEGEASRLMRNISEHIPLVEDDAIFLKQYVALQMMRTPAFVQTIGNLMDEGMSSVFFRQRGIPAVQGGYGLDWITGRRDIGLDTFGRSVR